MHIIAIGNPRDGFEYYGPFDNEQDAIRFANHDAHLSNEWWVVPLYSVEELNKGEQSCA